MEIQIRLFAAAAEAAGTPVVQLSVQAKDIVRITDVREALIASFPALEPVLIRSWFACNNEYADLDTMVRAGDELAVIPPVSGGSTDQPRSGKAMPSELPGVVAIVERPLSPALMYDFVVDSRSGAVVLFSGTVREFTNDRQTNFLEYEAYHDMAVAKMTQLIDECKSRWPIHKIAVWHRTGRLELTEASVLIGVSTAHRADAFAAGQYAIDRLKQIVPIWKKEFFQDGHIEWVGPKDPWDPLLRS